MTRFGIEGEQRIAADPVVAGHRRNIGKPPATAPLFQSSKITMPTLPGFLTSAGRRAWPVFRVLSDIPDRCRPMTRFLLILFLFLPACGGIAYNTKVADSYAVRRAMVESVVIGQTSEREFTTRWGNPVQKAYEGGQVEFIYRDMSDRATHKLFNRGDSGRYVIVTFQYGRAVAVRTNDTETCRATFPPRPPGPGFDNAGTVHPVPNCPGLMRPLDGSGIDGGDPIYEDAYPGSGKTK